MSLLQLIFIWFVPGSPRWLCSKDRGQEALDILIKVRKTQERTSFRVNRAILTNFCDRRKAAPYKLSESNMGLAQSQEHVRGVGEEPEGSIEIESDKTAHNLFSVCRYSGYGHDYYFS
jgi:hypothetical protein